MLTFSHENKEQHAAIQKNPTFDIRFQTGLYFDGKLSAFGVVSSTTEF